jgi:hypothetical protein
MMQPLLCKRYLKSTQVTMSVSSGVTLVVFDRLVFNEPAFNKIAFLIHNNQQGI